ncbi:OmpA family protein [Pelomonas sp. P7]|uniref:OmpA family protein n=1 Tax=Pelomonas caseinilytica TaxID=2906763 RepID=A0ABS8XAF8_9BURK|nr:OmpA family protein [Pelomonas sp. P7]MCE4535771.1 OmpA family protein [Pelomonas sp. P7]
MDAPDIYATAKTALRDNVKLVLSALAGVASLLLAGTPFSGLGSLPVDWRLGVALFSIGLAFCLLCLIFWRLLKTLEPMLVGFEDLLDSLDLDGIKEPRRRRAIADLRRVFADERTRRLPDGLPSVDALVEQIGQDWDPVAGHPRPEHKERYEKNLAMLEGLNVWAAFVTLQQLVSKALNRTVLAGMVVLAAILTFAWAANPPKAGAEEKPPVIVYEGATKPPLEAGQISFGPMLFASDKSDLDEAARKVLSGARLQLQTWPDSVVLVRANTDTRGTSRRNAKLAKERSEAVARELAKSGGIATNRIFVAALGLDDLPVITAANVDSAQNRSVVLIVQRQR